MKQPGRDVSIVSDHAIISLLQFNLPGPRTGVQARLDLQEQALSHGASSHIDQSVPDDEAAVLMHSPRNDPDICARQMSMACILMRTLPPEHLPVLGTRGTLTRCRAQQGVTVTSACTRMYSKTWRDTHKHTETKMHRCTYSFAHSLMLHATIWHSQ